MQEEMGMSSNDKTVRFASLDDAALDLASGGVSLTAKLRGLDVTNTGYWGIDEYDNGATTYWSGPDSGQTDLPAFYFDW